jgi:hypothetical protein
LHQGLIAYNGIGLKLDTPGIAWQPLDVGVKYDHNGENLSQVGQ